MAASQSMTTLCLLLTLTSAFARPVSVEQGGQRKLLQGTAVATADASAAAAFQTLAATPGVNQADVAAAFAKVIATLSQAEASRVLTLAALTAKATGNANVLANAVGDTTKSMPGSATTIGMVVAGAVGGSPSDPNLATGANVVATLMATNTGGITVASIAAYATAEAMATNASATAIATAIATVAGGGSVTAAATACAQAIGTAAAIAITNVTAKATVLGNGTAVGSGQANAVAFAKAFSQAFAAAFAKAANGGAMAQAYVLTTASTSAVAQACSSTEAMINLLGPGTVTTTVQALAFSFQQAISTVIATALAFVAPAKSG